MPTPLQHDNGPLAGLTFQFQPILGDDGKRLLAYETLARRARRDGTVEGPAVILAQLLQPQHIEAFTRFSLEFALQRLALDPYLPALSVNLSPRQIELAITHEVITAAPLALRRRLILELTEDPIVDHPTLVSVLHGLTALGVRVLLDDVALCSLQPFVTLRGAVHGVKLDRSLLEALAAASIPPEAGELISAAHESGLLLIAEGVEDATLLPRLAARGIGYFQGFALGEPWYEPKVARRRILAPRSGMLKPEPGLVSALAGVVGGKLN